MKVIQFIFLLNFLTISGQNSDFTIISFKYENSAGKETTHWIIENDSIGEHTKLNLKQVILKVDYSKTVLKRCCSETKINSIKESQNFLDNLEFTSEEMLKLLKRKRTFLQEVKHKYGTGLKTNLKVYATPIIGSFCNCLASDQQPLGIIINYVPTYLPKAMFTFDKSFKKSNQWKRLRYYDFSEYLYESFH